MENRRLGLVVGGATGQVAREVAEESDVARQTRRSQEYVETTATAEHK